MVKRNLIFQGANINRENHPLSDAGYPAISPFSDQSHNLRRNQGRTINILHADAVKIADSDKGPQPDPAKVTVIKRGWEIDALI